MQKTLSLLLIILAISGFAKTDPPKDTIDVMIGQMIMIGIGDFDIVDENEPIFKEIRNGKVGGVVLYEKNILFESPKPELALLVETLQKNASIPLFVSIDEEGGRVSRMKTRYGFPKNVSAQYLGDMDNIDSTRYYANQTASILSSFGINMNYAPVVDVNLNPRNPVIGKIERSYSSEYGGVIEQAHMVIDQHNKRGVIPVLKHFPGHGSSRNDTHLGLTDVTETWQIEEMYPYSALIDSGVVKAVMTAHIVNQTLDNTKNPATLSKKIVTGMLRDFLGFDGVVISDDMQMGAINNEYGLREAIKLSILAGVDMLMFANNVKDYNMISASTVHAIIKDLLFEGIITRDRIAQSYNRIMKLKAEAGLCDENYYRSLKNKLRVYN
ncbi:beta-N-acetylhexosaminidase [Ekhidna lutea]|uniref:beta-N-acetylhexosaminidase n=1 Tax=Ekhidna lutea TaxID=447679 RepID=A0A239ESG9_EKHLU|nr:glycoside hydrolase family 3 N-terminal domain-containing protein [Ekhidna lutea]SNS47351.1 beta-N-acetylhexosaminidase [Ekhidna lutea]